MLTPEQIDAALGALQQQIDDLRADGLPYAPKTCCGKDIVTEGGICTHCPYAPPEFQSHPDPAVAQLQRAVKQAGERLAERWNKSTPTVRRRRAASATTSYATVWAPSTSGWRNVGKRSR